MTKSPTSTTDVADPVQTTKNTVLVIDDVQEILEMWDYSWMSFSAMLRHLYSMPPFSTDASEETFRSKVFKWSQLHEVAYTFGVPSLQKLAVDRLERLLTELVVNPDTGTLVEEDKLSDFFDVMEEENAIVGHGSANVDVILKLCCKHFTQLLGCVRFISITNKNAEFCRLMLEYAARQGGNIVQ